MFFYALTAAGSSLVDVSVEYQKTMSDHYYCLVILSKSALKSSLLYYKNGAQKHEGFVGFKNTCSTARSYVILMSLNYIYFYACCC